MAGRNDENDDNICFGNRKFLNQEYNFSITIYSN